jgi:hypothetical protein
MARTTATKVEAVLLGEYDIDEAPDLAPFIDVAEAIVDAVVACSLRKGLTISSVTQEHLETWLAAHCYTASDPSYMEQQTERAKGVFSPLGDGLKSSRFGQMALQMDFTGCLRVVTSGIKATGGWLGKTVTERLPFIDRN